MIKFVFLALPVMLSAWRLCEDGSCVDGRQSRIIAGVISEQNSRPFQVALYARVGTTGELGFCGATLLHPEWVITAAHCCFHHGQQVDHVQFSMQWGTLRGCMVGRFYDMTVRALLVLHAVPMRRELPPQTMYPEDRAFINFAYKTKSPKVGGVRGKSAILGAHSLYDRYENGRRIVNVDEIRVHPDWDPATFANDLALLRLANTMQLTETIDVVRLPYLSISNFNFAGMGATVSGWGIAAPGVAFVSPTLREKLMTVMTDSLCSAYYFNELPPNTVCGFHANAGTCKGDNGGPMTIWYNSTEEVILIGVATFVDETGCNEERPSVFTRVQRYLQWISDNTGIVLD